MPNTNPTIVSASLDDKELQASINKMVANFDKGLQDMLDHTNTKVKEINEALKGIGNVNFGAKGSNDGAVVKQTKAQNDFTDAVKKSTNEIKRQGKEGEMSFDQIAAALSKARQTVSEFNTKRASGILPSSEDYKRYEQALARIVEYNDKLKQSALSRADANQWANVFDARRNTKDLFSTDERLKQLNKYYAEQEKLSQKATQDEERQRQKRVAAMEKESAAQKKMIDDQYKLSFARTMKIPTDQLDLAQAKLERLQALLRDMRERGILSNTQIASTEAEIRKLEQIIGQVNTAQQQTTQSAQRYTDEIRKQAQAIRESKQWKETGTYSYQIGDATYYVSKKQGEIEAQLVRHKEQQVNYEKDYLTTGMAVEQSTKQQAVTEEKLVQAEQQRLGIEQQITQEKEKQKKKYTSPTSNEWVYNQSLYNNFIKNRLGGKTPVSWRENTSDINTLNAALSQLRKVYSSLTSEERAHPYGQSTLDQIQRLERRLNVLRSEMSRPLSFNAAMGLPEKTLDDIAYKMQRLRAYKQGIDLTKPNAANEIKQVDEALAKLQKDADKWMSKSNEMIKSNTALGRSWNYMKNRLAFYFTVGASTQFVKNLIEVRSQYEMNERALGILIDSAERGTRIFNELSQMALVSPYTLIELSSAAKQLTAYDVAAKDVVDTTRRLADMAAAVGIPIERLTYALGQIKAYGYLNARDARMFSNAGIPLVKQLAEHYTELEGKMVSTADVYDRIKKKAIDMTDVMQVINKMTDEGGKFFDFQAKMAGTLKVQLANLTLAWNNMLNDIGASEQGTISTGIGLLKELFLQWKNINKMVTNLAIGFGVVKAAQLAYYGVVMGTNKAIALETVLGNRLSNNLRSLASSTNAARMSSTALWAGIATFAAAAVVDILRGNEAMKEFNKTLRENAENTYNDLKKFSENYSGLRESLYKTENGKQTPVDINSEEAKKAWEVLREQIELSSHASDEYIGKLLSIENVSERLRQGFAMIESIQSVSAAIKELGDSTIKLERDWSAWWNLGLLPDGTIGNLQDAYMWLSKIEEKYGSVVNARKVASTSRTDEDFKNVFQDEAKEFVENYETELEKFREDLQVTKQSIIDFIELKGWSGDTSKINEVFKTFTDNLILKNQLNPQQAYTLQLEMEEARSKAAKEALLQRINDERAALKISHDDSVREALAADVERYKNWDETNGRSKVEWERFTKWLKEQHISETTAMFRNMDAEDIRSLNFQEGKHAEWVKRMVTQYAKEHKMSYDDAFGYLKSWVTSANQWSIFIPMTISTEDPKTVYKQLGEYDKAIDDADAQIERLTKRINELNAKKKKSKEETKELADAEKELTRAQKDKADAEAKGGHGKKEKKDEKAANKAAKQAESELAKALKDELSTIEKVRSIYKDLTKEGMSHANAVERATRGWDETVNAINRVLQKNGLQKLDLSKFAGVENPRKLVNMLQSQLNTLLKRGAKPAEIKELQTKIQTLNVDAEKYDLTKITKGLNNELGKLKDEYELAVELDANPELGSIFADYMGIDLNELPKNAEEAAKKAQQYIDKILRENKSKEKIDIASLMGKDAFDKWIKSSGHSMDDELVKIVDNYRQTLHKMQVDESKKQMQEWDKLLEKYAEYEYKVTQIQKKAERERETARKKGASQEILDAIDERERQELAKLSFEEFQKSPEWIVATGDLANMSKSAIGMLIKQLEKFKHSAKDSPKQIKQLNSALSKLYKEQRKNNPFKAISNMLDEAKERMSTFDEDIKKTQEEIDKLTKKKAKSIADGIADDETNNKLNKAIERLKELKKNQEEVGKVSASDWVASINETVEAVKVAVGVFDDLAKAIGGVENSDLDKVFSVIDKAGQGAAVGAQIGGGYGAIIGAVVGAATSLVSIFAGAGNERITAEVEESERAVKRLENAYKNLEYAIEQAYGIAEYGARRAAIANKELQLVELQRQLMLEQSRDSKHRDEDRIQDLKGQIIDLRNEISQSVDDITNDLLGISSIGDAAEQLVSSMIDAFRQGEDYMKQYDESFEKMIDNMIMKAIVSRVIGDRIEQMWNQVKSVSEARGAEDRKRIEELTKQLSDAQDRATTAQSQYDETQEGWWGKIFEDTRKSKLDSANAELERIKAELAKAEKDYAKAIEPTKEDIDSMREMAAGWRDDVKSEFEYWMGAFGIGYGQDADSKQLSALQQGISQITEDTAGALESYMNGVSQQVYLQSDLLTQIRDAVVGFDMDVQTATMGEILLQLRSSYEVQMAIHGILEGWNNPSGQAVRVELVS